MRRQTRLNFAALIVALPLASVFVVAALTNFPLAAP